MRNETNTQNHRTTGTTPSVPWRLQEVRPLEAYRLYVCFLDGLEGFVDLSSLVMNEDAGVFKSPSDPDLFRKVYLIHGAVTWPGNIDLAPDAMYDAIKEKGEWVLH